MKTKSPGRISIDRMTDHDVVVIVSLLTALFGFMLVVLPKALLTLGPLGLAAPDPYPILWQTAFTVLIVLPSLVVAHRFFWLRHFIRQGVTLRARVVTVESSWWRTRIETVHVLNNEEFRIRHVTFIRPKVACGVGDDVCLVVSADEPTTGLMLDWYVESDRDEPVDAAVFPSANRTSVSRRSDPPSTKG